jgi:hypothetical protein
MHELIKLVLSLVYIATLLHGLGKQLKSEGNVPGVKSAKPYNSSINHLVYQF